MREDAIMSEDLIFSKHAREGRTGERRPYDGEDVLQEVLGKHPQLRSGGQIQPEDPVRWLPVTREAGITDRHRIRALALQKYGDDLSERVRAPKDRDPGADERTGPTSQRWSLPLMATALMWSFACGAGPTADDESGALELAIIERTSLGPVPAYTDTFAIGPTLQATVWAAPTGEGWAVYRNGTMVGGPYDGVAGLTLDLAGEHLGWAARNGDEWTVFIDDDSYGPFDGTGKRGIIFTEDGHWGFQATRDEQWLVVVDGRSSKPAPRSSPPLLGPSGRSAFLAGGDEDLTVYLDWEGVGTWTNALLQCFSPDGDRFAWTAEEDDGWHVFVDGIRHERAWDEVGYAAFSPDGTRLAAAGKRGEHWYLIDGDNELGPYADVTEPTWSSSGELGWVSQSEAGFVLHVDDWHSEPQQAIGVGSPQFGDGTFAWWSENDGVQHVWRGTEPITSVQTMSSLAPRPTGPDGVVAFVGFDGTGWYARVGDWESPRFREVATLEVAEDGRHVALVARDETGWGVFVGKPEPDAVLYAAYASGGAGTNFGGGVRFEDAEHVRFTLMHDDRIEAVLAKRP